MQAILGAFFSFLLLYKYAGLFLVAFTAALLLPLPTSTTLAAAGGFASQGYFSLPLVLLVAFAGNVAGDTVGYIISRRYGEDILRRLGFGRLMRGERYHTLTQYVHDSPQSLIFFSRFLTEMGPTVNILSGLSGVPVRTFFIFDILGNTSYVLLYGLVGYFLGSEWQNNFGFFTRGGLAVVSLGVFVNLIQFGLYRRRRKYMKSRTSTS